MEPEKIKEPFALHQSSNTETGITSAEEDKSSCLTIDANMIEMAEKAAIGMAMHLNDANAGQFDRERAQIVFIALSKVLSFVRSASTEENIAFSNVLLNKVQVIEILGTYFMQHWTDLKPCLDEFCTQFCQLTSGLLTTLSDLSKAARIRLVEFGLVTSLLQALNTFKDANFNEALQRRVLSSLILLSNCSKEALAYHEFDNVTKVIKVLTPYLKSTDSSIRMTAHSVAVYSGVFLREGEQKKLALTPTEVRKLVKALGLALRSPNLSASVFGLRISAREILSQLDLSMVVDSNLALLLKTEFLSIISSALKVDDKDSLEAAISFVWTISVSSHHDVNIAMDAPLRDLQQQLLVTKPILKELSASESMISDLADYAYLSLQTDLHSDVESMHKYIEGCYYHSRFYECQRVADAISKEPFSLLYKAKCIFKIYQRALNLQEFKNLGQQNVQGYINIMKNVKMVVSMLSTAFEKNYIDKEGKEQLDISMMNLIKGSNELNKVKYPRCMLCLCSDVRLQKSHVYPKSLLKEFAESIEEREGGRLFMMINTTSPKWLYRYSSPKDVRYFMLCAQCEDVVNQGGEIDFLQSFFLQMYSKSEPSRILKECTVKYGPWLYHFCISLVFRCIASVTGIPELVNKHEIYSLFLACREFLMSPDKISESTIPKISLFVNPREVPKKYEHCCLREALNAPGFFMIQTSDLSDGFSSRPLMGHFALAHCGIFNILVKFMPAFEVAVPSHWEVNPQGGSHIIPAEMDREKDIPEGVWVMFQQVSKSFYHHITESLFLKRDKPPEVKHEIDSVNYPHRRNSGILPEAYLCNPELFSVMSMLPSGFEINHFSSEVILPHGYTLLTHHTFISSDEGNVTLLVGVKNGDMPVPFVVFCRFVSLGGFFVGFSANFEKDSCQLKNLCETDLNPHSKEIQQGAKDAEKFIMDILPSALRKKGIINLQSLVYNHIYNSLVSVMDMKCPASLHCWYCKDLCENCLSPSSFGTGLTAHSETGISLKFCCQECSHHFTDSGMKPMSLDVEILPNKQHDSKSNTPKPLLQITGSGMLKKDEGVKVTCLIYSDEHLNGRFFVLCQLRSLFSQKIIEMFVSDKAVPTEPLPHINSPAGREVVANSKASGIISQIILSALHAVQGFIRSTVKESVELNLNMLTKFQSYLFEDEEVAESIKLTTTEMVVPQLLVIHNLTQKLIELQGTVQLQRKVDSEMSSAIRRQLADIQEGLTQFSKDSSELLRLLQCCCCFLAEGIRGLQNCNDDCSLTFAGSLFNEVWKTCSVIMVYTSSQELATRSVNEVISTLLDNIAKTTKESKDELGYQILLLDLLYCCTKDENFRQFVDFDSLSLVLQPLLIDRGSGLRVTALLSLSFFINDEMTEQQKQVLTLGKTDIELMKLHLVMKQITVTDALHLVKTSTLVSTNMAVLQSDTTQTFVSQFLDSTGASMGERKSAAEIIATLQSEGIRNTSDTSFNDLLESFVLLLGDCNTATAAEDSSYDYKSGVHVCQKLVELSEVDKLQSISKPILETATKQMCIFIKQHLMDEGHCSNLPILHSCGKLLIDICRYTTFHEVVVSEGLIGQIIKALKKFKEHKEPSEDILARIILCLVLLHLCSSEAIKQYYVLDDSYVVLLLLDYYRTSYLVIWMYAKLSMMHLGDLLDHNVLEILELTEDALTEFVSKLSESTEHPSQLVQVFGGPITGKEILTFLAEATLLEENCMRMLNVGLLECFPVLLQHDDTQIEAARLLWILSQKPAIRERINQEASLLHQIVEECSSRATIFELLLISLKGPTTQDFPKILIYAEGCYLHNMLAECAAYCKHLLLSERAATHNKDVCRVFLAKCQFKQYRKMQRLLSMKPHVNAEYISQHKSCYALAGQVVQSLKIVNQHGSNLDSESLKFLDIALMDISREGNENLRKYHYCLLCLKSDCELQHSHVIPKAILECFTSSIGETVGKKVFKAINFPMKKRFRYFTSKELAFYTFCKSCENIFNDQGEKGFLNFFKELYSPSDSDILEKHRKLEYGTWFYHFCVSLVFRSIATNSGIPDNMDSSEVYHCFLKCRKFLMGEYTLDSSELPKIFVLFNPTTVPMEHELEVLNQVLISPGFFFCDYTSLTDGLEVEPPVAQFMVAHIGILNILVPLIAKESAVFGKSKVSPAGGTCTVPCDSDRVLPKGIWKMFGSLSSDYRKQMQESFFHKQDKVPIPIQTVQTEDEMATQEVFKVMSACLKDTHLFADQCQQESLAILNLLPETFIIKREASVVVLPSDHHLLLHFNTPDGNNQDSTAFVGLLARKGKSVKPFVIHYQYSPTTVFCVGFYLSQEGEVENVICDSPLGDYPTVRMLIDEVQKSVPHALSVILNSKGFLNMRSLIYNFEHSTFECPLDVKCSVHPRCWYCQDRCENCLKRATILTSRPIIFNNVPLTFCSKECQAVFSGPSKPIEVLALPTRKSHSDTEKIEEGHTEICCIAGEGIIDGGGLRFKISVRVGYKSSSYPQGRYYCIFHFRTLFTQQCAEIFLHRDTSPDSPLPHVDCPGGQKQVQILRDEEILQGFIQAGFRVIKRQQQLGLTTVTEEIPTSSVRPLFDKLRPPLHAQGTNADHQPSGDVAHLSGIEEGFEHLRQLVPDLPSIHSFKHDNVYGVIVKCWKKLISSNKSTLESDISQILDTSIALLLQATEGTQTPPIVMDIVLSIVCKCLQSEVHRKHTDLSLLQSVVKTPLSQQNSQCRIFAMMILSNYLIHDQETVENSYLKLTKEDIKSISGLVGEGEDILSFLDTVRAIEDNSNTLCTYGGLELLGKVIEYSEIVQDIERAAVLLQALLSKGTQEM